MKSTTSAIGLVALAVVLVVLGFLYWGGTLQLLATHEGPHHTHALLLWGLAVLSLVGANFARPRTA